MSDTAKTITIKHDGVVEKFAKELLPADLVKRWPVDPQRLALEERQQKRAEIEAKNLARQKELKQIHTQKVREMEAKIAKEEAEFRANVYKRDHRDDPAPAPIDAAAVAQARRDAIAAELALCRDAVRLAGFGFWPAKNAITLKVRNAGENPRRLEWRELRALTSDGRVLEPLDVVFQVSDRVSYDVDAGGERTFTIVFPSATIAAVSWNDRADLGWIDLKGARVSHDDAIAAAKDRLIAEQRAKKKPRLESVDGQLVQQ